MPTSFDSLFAPRRGRWFLVLCVAGVLAAACSDDDTNKKRGADDAGTGDGSANGGDGGSAGNSSAGTGASGGSAGMAGSGAAGAGGSATGGAGGASGGTAGSAGAAGAATGGAAGTSGGSAGAAGAGGTGPMLFCGDGLVDLSKEECDGNAEGRAGDTVTCDTNCKLKSWCNITPTPATGAPGIGCIFPPAGRASGGTYATISGVGFDANTVVRIGGVAATMIFRSATEITFFAPSGTVNTWADVEVENASGQTATRTRAFAFHPDANVAMNANDSGTDSLRAKIAAASPGDFVTLDRFVAGQTIQLASQISCLKALTIVGLGADLSVLDGGGATRVMLTGGSGNIEIHGLTLTNGSSSSLGAGLFNQGAKLTITECAITSNVSTNEGGGIATQNSGTLTLLRSTVSGNTGNAGGGIRTIGPTVSVTIINSTISDNTGDGVFNDVPLSVEASTIVGNSGAGINARLGTCTLTGSLVAKNGTDVTGSFVSGGHNLLGVASVGGPWGSSDRFGTSGSPLDPLISVLGLNFGRTQTHRLLTGSPAIDGGDPVSTLTEDQARMPRPSGGVVDIGSVELQQ
ncbi:MAG: choice-of-anchor Q domain-containing protein [Polyangiaceae bacterium]